MKQGNTKMQKLLMSTRNNLMIQINALDKAIDREKAKLEPEWKKPSRIFLPGYDEEFNDNIQKLNVLRSLHEMYGEGYKFTPGQNNYHPIYNVSTGSYLFDYWLYQKHFCTYYYSEPVPEVLKHLDRLRKKGVI